MFIIINTLQEKHDKLPNYMSHSQDFKNLVFKNRARILLLLLILSVGLYVFQDFLFFRKIYIYQDIGSDSFSYALPHLAFLNDHLRSFSFSTWNFSIGIGQSNFAMNQFLFEPLYYLLAVFEKKDFPFLLGYLALLKSLLAGIFFQNYLRQMKVSDFSTVVGGLIYAFSGYIILWGQHYNFASACVYLALVLWNFERLVQQKKWLGFSLSIFLLASWSYYFLFMIGVMLTIYAQFRIYAVQKPGLLMIAKANLKILLPSLLGIGLSGFILLPSLQTLFSGARLSHEVPPLFAMDSASYYLSLVSRFFSNHISFAHGTHHFYDWWNYYEAPNVYCGLLSVLLIPLIFVYEKPALKSLFVAALTIGLFLTMPFLSAFLNAFSYVSYRWTFLLLPILILAATKVLSEIECSTRPGNSRFVFASGVLSLVLFSGTVCLAPFVYNWSSADIISSFVENKGIFILIVLYLFSIRYLQSRRWKTVSKIMILVLLSFELGLHSSVDVNQRLLLSPQYISDNQGIFDDTNAILKYIRKRDLGFFRINKFYNGADWNDPIAQDYYSTTSYISINNASYLSYLKAWDVYYPNFNVTHIPFDRFILSDLLAVKYLVVSNDLDVPFGYEKSGRFGKLSLYENKFALPIGIAYENYSTKAAFLHLRTFEKDRLALSAFVAEEGDSVFLGGISEIQPQPSNASPPSFQKIALEKPIFFENLKLLDERFPVLMDFISTYNDPYIVLQLPRTMSGLLRVSFDIDCSQDVTGHFWWRKGEGAFLDQRAQYELFKKGDHHYDIDLGYVDSIDRLRFDLANNTGHFVIKNFSVEMASQVLDTRLFESAVKDFKKETFEVTQSLPSAIMGNITMSKKKMLVLSIPYGKGWFAMVDGHEQKMFLVNSGLTGLLLEAGSHEVKLTYFQPLFRAGIFISLMSLMILIILILLKYFEIPLLHRLLKR